MEPFNLLFGINMVLSLTKIFFLMVNLLFTVFLIVVVRQVFSMNTIVHDVHDEFILKTTAVILLVISISLFLTAIVIL